MRKISLIYVVFGLKEQNIAHMIDIIEIAAEIRAARKQKKMTQSQLATAAGISRRSVVELEAGRSPDPGFITVVRILMAVGLDLRITEFNHRRPSYEDLLAESRRGTL
jgi:transcriptional regulator with XRE-family HTH domain|tara:strand:- start:93 stop:416 length:324 start_codon:yes stop_codon:yes gene_type:complete